MMGFTTETTLAYTGAQRVPEWFVDDYSTCVKRDLRPPKSRRGFIRRPPTWWCNLHPNLDETRRIATPVTPTNARPPRFNEGGDPTKSLVPAPWTKPDHFGTRPASEIKSVTLPIGYDCGEEKRVAMLKVNNARERARAVKWKERQQVPKHTPPPSTLSRPPEPPRDLGAIFRDTRPYSQAGIKLEHLTLETLPYDLALGSGMGFGGCGVWQRSKTKEPANPKGYAAPDCWIEQETNPELPIKGCWCKVCGGRSGNSNEMHVCCKERPPMLPGAQAVSPTRWL